MKRRAAITAKPASSRPPLSHSTPCTLRSSTTNDASSGPPAPPNSWAPALCMAARGEGSASVTMGAMNGAAKRHNRAAGGGDRQPPEIAGPPAQPGGQEAANDLGQERGPYCGARHIGAEPDLMS